MALENRHRPRVAITMGDAAGIGPEVIVKALSPPQSLADIDTVVIGDAGHLSVVADSLQLSPLAARDVIDLENLSGPVEYGADSAAAGKAAAEYIIHAVELWRRGEIDAVATAPISKNSIRLGGYDFQGHTEFLAHLLTTDRFAMSFFAGDLRVVLLSTHLPLLRAIERVKADSLSNLITFTDNALGELLGRKVRIAVAGLNPHASEGGLFGSEEADEITPAIEMARSAGADVVGPFSPDTVFLRCSRGEFDVVVALYHDQATIPVKALSFNSAVNVTLGLPMIRTSVDHGTAYDIAGKGVADESSMIAAVRLASQLATVKPRR